MVKRLALWLLLGWALAQAPAIPTTAAYLGQIAAEVAFPANAGVPYASAPLLAESLGLGYLDSDRVYLSLGSRSLSFPKTFGQFDAIKQGGAWRRDGVFWVPLPAVAQALDLEFRQRPDVAIGLRPARLEQVTVQQNQKRQRFVFRLNQDVPARLEANRLFLVGVNENAASLPDLTFSQTVSGLEVILPPNPLTVPGLRVSFLPKQVIVERGLPSELPLRVVLDAANGGSDTGSVFSGLREKDLTLDLARKIQQAIAGYPLPVGTLPVEVAQTRSADQNLALAARAQQAAYSAVFLSLHVSSGRTVQLLSQQESRSASAARSGRAAYGKANAEQQLVLARYFSAPGASAKLAELLQQALGGQASVTRTEGDWLVLKQATGAALIIEVGVELLSTPEGRSRVAAALAGSVLDHLGVLP